MFVLTGIVRIAHVGKYLFYVSRRDRIFWDSGLLPLNGQ